jgi:hypothetical protein
MDCMCLERCSVGFTANKRFGNKNKKRVEKHSDKTV